MIIMPLLVTLILSLQIKQEETQRLKLFANHFCFQIRHKQRKPRLKSQLDYNFTQQGRVHF